MADINDVVFLRLTPYQSKRLRAHFRKVAEAAKIGKKGILAAQLYPAGDFVHGRGRADVASMRVGFLKHEYAETLQRHAIPAARDALGKS